LFGFVLVKYSFLELRNKMLIHQIWLQGWKYAPRHIQERVEKNKELWGPSSQVLLWDESRLLALMEAQYKEYIPWYTSLQQVITKCDVARAFILHSYGGIYADCDFDPNPTTIQMFMEEAVTKVTFIGSPWYGCNNFLIASPPKHSFWLEKYIPFIQESLEHPSFFDFVINLFQSTWKVLSSSGPIAVNRLVKTYPQLAQCTSSENEYAYGFHGSKHLSSSSFWYLFKLHRLQQTIMLSLLLLSIVGTFHIIKKLM
jgi:mannosyltransferase OCH1-like enzyme